MPYVVNGYDGNLVATIADGTLDTTSTSLKLQGRNYVNYGEIVAENFVHLLENFAGESAPTGTPLIGQLWYDKANEVIKVYDGVAFVVANQDLYDDRYVNVDGDTMSGILDMGDNRITNVGNATADGDALNRIAADGRFLLLTGGTLTGDLTMAANILPSGSRDIGASGNTFNVIYANTFEGTATQARYADLAERYAADGPTEPGDVVKIGGEAEITLSEREADQDVFGIIATAPALMMNSKAGPDKTHPYVTLAGRVPCKVVGPVRKGQRLMTSSIRGVAVAMGEDIMAAMPFAAFGRALVSKETDGIELIEVVLGVR